MTTHPVKFVVLYSGKTIELPNQRQSSGKKRYIGRGRGERALRKSKHNGKLRGNKLEAVKATEQEPEKMNRAFGFTNKLRQSLRGAENQREDGVNETPHWNRGNYRMQATS